MNQQLAATTIQRFWQKREGKKGLSSDLNYNYYLQLLSFNEVDYYSRLAMMMYGRVIASPKAGFPYLQQQNPYTSQNAVYHRNDVLGSFLTHFILNQWGVAIDPGSIYIPVINTQLGTISTALKALGWKEGSAYELIDPPKHIPNAQLIKFVKIKRDPSLQDDFFTSYNRWGQLSALGVIASPWVLSSVAVACGFKPEDKAEYQKTTHLSKVALTRQPQTVEELKKSDLVKKLELLKNNKKSDASLLAQAIYDMIHALPEIDAPDNIARLSYFIELALLFHQDDHAQMANFTSAIVHELSLLVVKYSDSHPEPLINIEQYQSKTKQEFQQWTGLNQGDYEFLALPAHSGSHANLIASQLAQELSSNPAVCRVGGEYWEVMSDARKYTVLGPQKGIFSSGIVRCSAGIIGDYTAGTYPAIDLNKLIRKIVRLNPSAQCLVIDTTTAAYKDLRLDPDVIELLNKRGISLFLWESCQKFGLLHTDQAQYGRVIAYCHKSKAPSLYIDSLKNKAKMDMNIPDVQIGSFIGTHCHKAIERIKERHFTNGKVWRKALVDDNYHGINHSLSYGIEVENQSDLFFYTGVHLSREQQYKMDDFFRAFDVERCSFGHRYTTKEGQQRIAAGAENPIDAYIFAKGLRYYLSSTAEGIYYQLLSKSKSLNLANKEDVVDYLSLVKAWYVCADSRFPMTEKMAFQLHLIVSNSKRLKPILNNSHQFVSDIYTIFEQRSPFGAMIQQALNNNNTFAIQLFETMNESFTKTGKIDIENGIKKTIRTMHKLPFESPIDNHLIHRHYLALLTGDYSAFAAGFFLAQLKQRNSAYALDEMLLKIEGLRKKFIMDNEQEAADATLKLYQALDWALKKYQSSKKSQKDFELFKNSCLSAISTAKLVLDRHYDWPTFLLELIICVASLGITPAIVGVKNRVIHGEWNFKLFTPTTTKALNAMSEQVNSFEYKIAEEHPSPSM